jgi:hypothetical protein
VRRHAATGGTSGGGTPGNNTPEDSQEW